MLFDQVSCQTTRLKPKIENAVRNLLKFLEHPKAEDRAALFSDISILRKTLRKLEGWIKNPRHPNRSQKIYLSDGILMVKESAKLTQLKFNNMALQKAYGWTEDELTNWMELVVKTEEIRLKLLDTIKLRSRKPAEVKKFYDTSDFS